MNETEHLNALKDIRQLMERSSTFLSLSGVSGICAGLFALVGAAAAYWYMDLSLNESANYAFTSTLRSKADLTFFILADALLVLLASLSCGFYFSNRKALKNGVKIFDAAAKRLFINLLIPLLTGGAFCLVLIKQQNIALVAPSMLIFYGLALVNGSKYTLAMVRYLGIFEIILGLLACCFLGYGLLFWSLGFGVLHIIYGWLMYKRYEA